MVVVQFRIQATKKDKRLDGHFQLDLLKREDATEVECAIAESVEVAVKSYLEMIKPHCKKFDLETIK